jgi:peptidoglycan hydrolase-like protein with peptidoglycan-binding domain
VRCLQKYLNNSGFIVSTAGEGSPGQESDYFGSKTKKAVAAWQKANLLSPTNGYFGPQSRAKYLELTNQSA